MGIIKSFFNESINLWLEVAPYLLMGMIIAGILHIFLGKSFINNHLGRGGLSSIVKATILGIPLPVCSCGVIPLASSLRKDGAHKSSVLSFLVSTPTTGVDSILATYSLLGPLFTLFRPLGALLAGIAVGGADYILEGKNEFVPPRHHHQEDSSTKMGKIKNFIFYSFFEIPRDIGKWLIIGTIIGGAISAFIPKELLSQYVSFPFDFAIALLVGIPLYVCATGSIPVAVSLIAKGFSPGAGLIFLIAGPATNAITLSFVRAKLGKKSFYIYLISIIVVSIILGLLFNYIWVLLGKDTALISGMGKMMPFYVKMTSAIILLLFILNAIIPRKSLVIAADLEVSVPDIDCAHCKITIESALKQLDEVEDASVDIKTKKVVIKGTANRKEVIEKIKEAGYNPLD